MTKRTTTANTPISCGHGGKHDEDVVMKLISISHLALGAVKRRLVQLVLRIGVKIRHFLFLWACGGPMALLGRLLLKFLNWQPVHLGKFSAITTESMTVAAAASSSVFAPKFYGNSSLVRSDIFPAIQAHELRGDNAIIIASPYSPAVLCANQLYLPRQLLTEYERVQTDNGGFFRLENSFSVGKINASIEIEEGIIIGGAGAFNWYHFVVEILPKLFLVQQLPVRYKDIPLLLPDECKNIPSFSIALKLFSDNRKIHFIQRGQSVGLKKLVVFDEVSIGPFNLATSEWPRISDYAQHDAVMHSFFVAFRSKLFGNESSREDKVLVGRRLFLTRPGIRRKFNQDELLEIATRFGFEKFSAEEFTLLEQAKIFSEADAVVGPSGAAWVGMMFNERSLKGLSWLPLEYNEFCSYSTMAHTLGHELDFIEAETENILKSTGDAYGAAQNICPIKFEEALKNILKEEQ